MMDKYEKIVWALRECCGDGSDEAQFCDCDSCPYKEYIEEHDCYTDYTKCGDKVGRDAADAIEELVQLCANLHEELVQTRTNLTLMDGCDCLDGVANAVEQERRL